MPLLESGPVLSAEAWPGLHDRSTAVALARHVFLRHEPALRSDVDIALTTCVDVEPFWLVMHRAVHDLRAKMKALIVELSTAAALVLQEDLRDPKAATARVAAQLAEDMLNNPWLKGWK